MSPFLSLCLVLEREVEANHLGKQLGKDLVTYLCSAAGTERYPQAQQSPEV
jgi:hypothetical protein